MIEIDLANLSKRFVFPGGEVGIKIEPAKTTFGKDKDINITARIRNSEDFFVLAMLKNAIEEHYLSINLSKPNIHLTLPYVPYARQDRVCDRGESFSLKVFAQLLNSLEFVSVTVYDPHSDVTPALINNCVVVDLCSIFNNSLTPTIYEYTLLSPDAGSNKKISKLAAHLGKSKFIRADKLRDLATGKITETVVYGDVTGLNILICDDICDGGRTFIELAKVLKAKGAASVALYVTHGIFSQGIQPLTDAGIERIITTNTICNLEITKNLYVSKIV